jgi:hypothetical protein
MSKGPTGLGKKYTDAVKREYINIEFTPKIWCSYYAHCRANDLMFNENNKVCFLCKWRMPLDIPTILNKEVENGSS